MVMAVIARRVVAEQQAGLGSPGIDELRWKKPVYPGDTLTVSGEVLEKTPSRSRPDIGSFRTMTTVTNQHDEVVMTFISIVLIRRRPAADQQS
jgi:acyl dehydratase